MTQELQNQEVTMTLYTLCKIAKFKDHSKAKKKVDKLMDNKEFGTVAKTESVYNKQGQSLSTYLLNEAQSMAVMAKLNDAYLIRLVAAFSELKAGQQVIRVLTPEEILEQQVKINSQTRIELANKADKQELEDLSAKVNALPDQLDLQRAVKAHTGNQVVNKSYTAVTGGHEPIGVILKLHSHIGIAVVPARELIQNHSAIFIIKRGRNSYYPVKRTVEFLLQVASASKPTGRKNTYRYATVVFTRK